MNLVKCPFCGKEIESDSFFCDQCGKELMICPVGHGFKKSRMCNECGRPLVSAKEATTSYMDTVIGKIQVKGKPNENPEISTGNEKTEKTPESTVRPKMPPTGPQHLVNNTLNARLQLLDGAIIGRRAGNYVHIFGSQGYVSATHARLQKNASDVWEIADLDSTNGTFLNGVRLVPHHPIPFKVGDTIAFYDLKFIVE